MNKSRHILNLSCGITVTMLFAEETAKGNPPRDGRQIPLNRDRELDDKLDRDVLRERVSGIEAQPVDHSGGRGRRPR
jgi:hypothetical protein